MPVCRTLLALLLCATLGRAAAELRTLKGDTIQGELVSINDKEIVLLKGKDKIATPLAQVLQLDLGPAGKLPDGKYVDVELIDGTLLHCAVFSPRGKTVDLKTVAGQEIKELPLSKITYVLTNAQDEKNRKDWAERLAKKRRLDLLVGRNKEGGLTALEGTLGDVDEKGETIDIIIKDFGKRPVDMARVHGLLWVRPPDTTLTPLQCLLFDSHRNVVKVSEVVSTPTGLKVTTQTGTKLEYAKEAVARLDFSKGKLTFLSDLEPSKVVENYNAGGEPYHYRPDHNQDGGPIRVGGVNFAKGLSLHSYTELEYDLNGEYQEFRTVAGINQMVGGIEGPVKLTIALDGKEWKTLTFTRKDKKPDNEIVVNVKDVQKLRLVVSSGDLFDLGKHLDLGDARVIKVTPTGER